MLLTWFRRCHSCSVADGPCHQKFWLRARGAGKGVDTPIAIGQRINFQQSGVTATFAWGATAEGLPELVMQLPELQQANLQAHAPRLVLRSDKADVNGQEVHKFVTENFVQPYLVRDGKEPNLSIPGMLGYAAKNDTWRNYMEKHFKPSSMQEQSFQVICDRVTEAVSAASSTPAHPLYPFRVHQEPTSAFAALFLDTRPQSTLHPRGDRTVTFYADKTIMVTLITGVPLDPNFTDDSFEAPVKHADQLLAILQALSPYSAYVCPGNTKSAHIAGIKSQRDQVIYGREGNKVAARLYTQPFLRTRDTAVFRASDLAPEAAQVLTAIEETIRPCGTGKWPRCHGLVKATPSDHMCGGCDYYATNSMRK